MERTFIPRTGGEGRAVHDVGGLSMGPIDRHEHALSFYEKRVDALVMLLARPGVLGMRIDALRRAVEGYAETEYDGTPYYDRWIRAIRNLVVELEVLTAEEIETRMAEIRKRLEAQGQTVSKEPIP